LLDWDKDSYTERFLALLPCTFYITTHIGSSIPDLLTTSCPLPTMAADILRLLYSLLYSEHIKHFKVLGLLSFPYSFLPCTFSPWCVTHVQ
jgi:hypothetical protein